MEVSGSVVVSINTFYIQINMTPIKDNDRRQTAIAIVNI